VIVAAAPAAGWQRSSRAGTVVGISMALGATAHWAEGGCVSASALGAAGLGVAAGTWLLTRREVRGEALLLWLSLAQLFLHLALAAACAGEAGGTGVATHRSPVWMLLAHAAAVTGAAAGLRSGEAGLWARDRLRRGCCRIAALLAALVAAPAGAWRGGVRTAGITPHRSRVARRRDLVLSTGGRRGPPAALAAA
jgi:hypothetical protein